MKERKMPRILQELGQGACGVVYLLQAEDSLEFALKVVRQLKAEEGDLKEAEILTKYCHPHLVKCFKFFKLRSSLYMITEYCGHGTLKDYIQKQEHYISEKNVLRMLCQLSDVLRYLHDSRIIHRDLKPANIFLDTENNVKVGDVGVARQLDHTFDKASTFAGTRIYMSPEIRSGQRYTSKTDIWSLGCCVHEMMTLKRTFAGRLQMSELHIPAMSQEMYSGSLQDLVLHMLSKDPNNRPDAHEILFQACAIRGKHYKSGDLVPNVEIEMQPREVCLAVTRFEAAQDLASFSDDTVGEIGNDRHTENSETEETVETVRRNYNHRRSYGARSQENFSNLQRDTFGTMSTMKTNRQREGYSTFSTDSTESARSELREQKDFADSSLSSRHTRNSGSFRGSGSSEDTTSYDAEDLYSTNQCYSTSDMESPVTLYTRAQHATYSNRPGNNTSEVSASELAQCTETVFAGQSESLKRLMLKRVAGVQSYKVDGQPMLNHRPF